VPPGRPVRNDARRTLEKFHVCLLLVLGIAFFGAGITAIGFAIDLPGAIGLGTGAVVAAGLIAVFFALAGSLTVEQESVPIDDASIAPLSPDPDPEDRRPACRPEALRRILLSCLTYRASGPNHFGPWFGNLREYLAHLV
jgi:hypothetical protein